MQLYLELMEILPPEVLTHALCAQVSHPALPQGNVLQSISEVDVPRVVK